MANGNVPIFDLCLFDQTWRANSGTGVVREPGRVALAFWRID